jgi:hypothetical protein
MVINKGSLSLFLFLCQLCIGLIHHPSIIKNIYQETVSKQFRSQEYGGHKFFGIKDSTSDNNKIDADDHTNGLWKSGNDVPSPLHLIVDYNMERNSVVYEVSLGREIGLDIIPGRNGLAIVKEVMYFSFYFIIILTV